MKDTALHRQLFFLLIGVLVLSIVGCDAFTKKFTRKPKTQEAEPEMILTPVVYEPKIESNKNLYANYYVVWKSWYGELLDSMYPDLNHKKQLECINYVIQNLENMRNLLLEQKQKVLDEKLIQLNEIKEIIAAPNMNLDFSSLRDRLDLIRRAIHKDFSYPKIEKWIK